MLPSLPLSGLDQSSPTPPSLPSIPSLSPAGLVQAPPTSAMMSDVSSPSSAKSFVFRTSPVGSPFTMTKALPRIFWRPALPPPSEAPPLDLTAPLSLPTLSASPTKSATPNQGTPTSAMLSDVSSEGLDRSPPTSPTSARPATPNQGLPTYPLSEPPQRPKLVCSIPLNVSAPESASVPTTTRSQPNTADSQTISLPYGWTKRIVTRSTGNDKNRVDVYLRPPNGTQLRSRAELQKYFEKHPGVPHDLAVTNFNKYDVPEVNDSADSSLSGDDSADLVENGDQENPEHSPSPPRGRMPARSISRSIPNTSATDIFEESTF